MCYRASNSITSTLLSELRSYPVQNQATNTQPQKKVVGRQQHRIPIDNRSYSNTKLSRIVIGAPNQRRRTLSSPVDRFS